MALDISPDRSKIHDPRVATIADLYEQSSIAEVVSGALASIPESLTQPVAQALRAHVTKERPLQVMLAGTELGVSEDQARIMAAAIDIGWASGIVLDDLYDKDTESGGEKSAWTSFGQIKSLGSVALSVLAAERLLARSFGEPAGVAYMTALTAGAYSLAKPRHLTFASSEGQLLHLYDLRSRFYTTYPLAKLGALSGAPSQRAAAIGGCLRVMNRAGQIINDVQDFHPSARNIRHEGLSDIRNSAISLPILYLWRSLSGTPRAWLQDIMDRNDRLDDETQQRIIELYKEAHIAETMGRLCRSMYERSIKTYKQLGVTAATHDFLDVWQSYKFHQIDELE